MSLITMGSLITASSLLVCVGVRGATGDIVGKTAVGEAIGFSVGEIVVGQIARDTDQFVVGSLVKPAVGLFLGASVGEFVGDYVGVFVGTSVGPPIGIPIGFNIGDVLKGEVESSVGTFVGLPVRFGMGTLVGP